MLSYGIKQDFKFFISLFFLRSDRQTLLRLTIFIQIFFLTFHNGEFPCGRLVLSAECARWVVGTASHPQGVLATLRNQICGDWKCLQQEQLAIFKGSLQPCITRCEFDCVK